MCYLNAVPPGRCRAYSNLKSADRYRPRVISASQAHIGHLVAAGFEQPEGTIRRVYNDM